MEFQVAGVSDFDDLVITDNGIDTVISTTGSPSATVTLVGFHDPLTPLTASDFLFVYGLCVTNRHRAAHGVVASAKLQRATKLAPPPPGTTGAVCLRGQLRPRLPALAGAKVAGRPRS